MPALRQMVESTRAALSEFDPSLHAGVDCAELAEEFARAAKAFETASARAAARAVECGVRGRTAQSTAWFAKTRGSSTFDARQALDTVNGLGELHATADALVRGDLSLAEAAEIRSAPDHEAELLELAQSSGLRAVKDRTRTLRLESMDVDDLHERQTASQEFSHWTDKLGMTRFSGALPPEVGVPFANRVDRETDRLIRAAKKRGPIMARAFYAAQAFANIVAARGKHRGGRDVDLVLVCDLNAYRRGHAHDGERCHVIGGGPIPVDIAREMAKDAFLKVVLHDGTAIHTVTHFGRHRPALLETALLLGAPPEFAGVTCAEPGCGRQYGIEWDHVDPVANHGPTSYENLKPKCKPCHWEKTERDRAAGLLGSARGP